MNYFGMKPLLKKIKREIKLSILNAKWRNTNADNSTSLGILCDSSCIKVGKGTYGRIDAYDFDHKGNPDVALYIGNYCSIARNVSFLLAGEHPLNNVSTFPFDTIYGSGVPTSISKGPIRIDDDVWIGHGAIILSGVHIGQGAVIAAGAVVNKDVAPYAIVGGVPAKIIRYRFSDEIISVLMKIDFNGLDVQVWENSKSLFMKPVDSAQEIYRELQERGVLKENGEKHNK